MSGHTPGPWETKWPKYNCTIESRGGVVATVYIGQTIGDDESVANANLIAAAPDLLAALKAMLHDIETGVLVRDITRDDQPNWSMEMLAFVQRLQAAQQAIAKAQQP